MEKFILNKGLTNEFSTVIKQNKSTLPMLIDVGDVFTAKLFKLSDGLDSGAIIVVTTEDANSGKIKLTFSSTDVNALISERGFKEDRYPIKPTYRLAIDASTLNNGDFVANVELVYVR